jgi:hypothetical protein
MKRSRWWCLAVLGLVVAGLVVPNLVVAGDEVPLERDEMPKVSGTLSHLLSGGFGGGIGGGSLSNPTCTSTGNPAANVQLNCDTATSPDNETPIIADPLDPNHLLAGSNDYYITFTGSTTHGRTPTGFFTSFDGGHTWTDGQIPMGNGASSGNGDPSPAFDSKFHTAHMAQLSAAQGNSPNAGHIDVSVSTSTDGGLSWKPPVTVAVGHASIGPSANGVFLDKEWLVADNYPSSPHYGRLYLSWDQIELDKGALVRSPVVLSYSDDAGKSWTRPVEISGSNPTYCTANQGPAGPPGACDESFFSYGAVRPNGDVVVGFINQQHAAAWEVPNEFENQILTVTSHDGGVTWTNPVHVEDLEDGGTESVVFSDYPSNVNVRATQSGFQFRTGSWGNLNVDPVTGNVYLVWTDNRDGLHDVPNPVTDTNVFMSMSTNGVTWSAPIRVTSGASDKWFPWVAARGGKVGVLYQEEAGPGLYVTRLATSTNNGASWSYQTVSNAVSDANHSVWFRAHAPDCDQCATFIGDYIGLAFDTLGRAHMTWTDMRRDIAVPEIGRTGKAQDDEYAQR